MWNVKYTFIDSIIDKLNKLQCVLSLSSKMDWSLTALYKYYHKIIQA